MMNLKIDNRPVLRALLKAKARSFGYAWEQIEDDDLIISHLLIEIENDFCDSCGTNLVSQPVTSLLVPIKKAKPR